MLRYQRGMNVSIRFSRRLRLDVAHGHAGPSRTKATPPRTWPTSPKPLRARMLYRLPPPAIAYLHKRQACLSPHSRNAVLAFFITQGEKSIQRRHDDLLIGNPPAGPPRLSSLIADLV